MSHWHGLALALFLISAVGVAGDSLIYPLCVLLSSAFGRRTKPGGPADSPSVAMVVVVRNGEALIERKIRNALELDYPPDKLDLIVYSDGSTDKTVETVEALRNDRTSVLVEREHLGKIQGLNRSVERASADLLVFSDADAVLRPDALRRLVERFADPSVGGCCGQRSIEGRRGHLVEGQNLYVKFDSWIKRLESRSGSITSNDGKLYAIRRNLFKPIPDSVTDDLYVLLCVVKQGFRFVFAGEAIASIPAPARDAGHEVERRRRIVSRSLRGIRLSSELLNPLRHGAFSAKLFVNKIVRRLLPCFLGLFLLSTALLASASGFFATLLALQVAFYALALCDPLLRFRLPGGAGAVAKAASVAFFFCLGNFGTFLGLLDFLRGRSVAKWDPLKTGQSEGL